jgi:D-alanyl-D-alanine carboxypeptidase
MTSGFAQALPLLDAWTAHTVMQQQLPGVALTVVHGDRSVWSRAFGCARVGGPAATPQTLYRVGSITKTFTALAILQLCEDGRLRLDDRIRDHLTTTAIRARSIGLLDVTVRELLTHSSGLQRDLPGTWWTQPAFPTQLSDDFNATYASSSRWKYSNVGYALLGEVVAAAGGEPWARHVERRILEPLGMTSSSAAAPRDEARLATGYSRPMPGVPHVPANHADHGALAPAISVVSSAEDMGRYLAFHLGGGAILGAKSLREMHRPQWLLDDWQTAWGLGVRVRRVDGRVRVGHPGTTPGFASLMEFIPELKLGVVALTNADDGNPAGFCDYALQLLAPIAARAAARTLATESAERYCGPYRSENGNLTMLVAVLDGQLSLVAPGAANPYAARVILEPAAEPHVFIMRSSGAFATLPFGERLTFSVDAGGEVTGYAATGARYARQSDAELPGVPLLRPIQAALDRRRQPQQPYTGVERRSGGPDRRGQRTPPLH